LPIPTYEEFMLPMLLLVKNGTDHRLSDVQERLAEDLALTDEDRQELLPSGKQRTYLNRINWARFYLGKQAC
jgi:restriction system protein